MVEQAQGIQERKARLEIYRPTRAPTEASQEIPRPTAASTAVPQKPIVIIRRKPRAAERKSTLTLTITRISG